MAALQILLEQAVLTGDESARWLYAEAAKELALMVKGLRGRMELPSGSPFSYAGGLWGASDLILTPFLEALDGLDMRFTRPRLLPVDGAILFAVDAFNPAAMARVIRGLMAARDSSNKKSKL